VRIGSDRRKYDRYRARRIEADSWPPLLLFARRVRIGSDSVNTIAIARTTTPRRRYVRFPCRVRIGSDSVNTIAIARRE
jgi:hypothetical protein